MKELRMKCDFMDLLHRIEVGNVGFFWGAGMSRKAGIPTVEEIKARVLDAFHLSQYKEKVLNLPFPFESFMEILTWYTSIDNLISIYNVGRPTEFHYILKNLLDMGLLRQMMTTNFDSLLEKTIEPNKLNILYKESQFVNFSSDIHNYIKIRGCVLHENKQEKSIRTVMNSIVQRRLRRRRKQAIEFMFKDAGLSTIFVMGYSCSDKMDITPYVRAIKDSDTEVVYIQHSGSYEEVKIEPYSENDLFFGFKGYKCICNTDFFLASIISYFNFDISIDNQNVATEVEACFDFSQLTQAECSLALSHILFRNGKYSMAVSILNSVLKFGCAPITRADIYVMLFELYHNQIESEQQNSDVLKQRMPEMREWMRCSKKIYQKADVKNKEKLYKLGQLYNHWGHILLSAQEYTKAIRSYHRAYQYFQQSNNHFRMWQIKNNYANTYFMRFVNSNETDNKSRSHIYHYIEPIWKDCYYFYRDSGYLYEYAISCQNLASLLLTCRPECSKQIRRYIHNAHNVYTYLNDVRGMDDCDKMLKQCV